MKRPAIIGRLLAFGISSITAVACYAGVAAGPTEECRNVEVRNRHDVEVCHSRCTDNGCHEHCSERERWAHEHRCWAE